MMAVPEAEEQMELAVQQVHQDKEMTEELPPQQPEEEEEAEPEK
jgi:hypothetical protein